MSDERIMTQAEAEAGTSTEKLATTPERQKQAIDALSNGSRARGLSSQVLPDISSNPSLGGIGEMGVWLLPDAATVGVISHFDIPQDIDLTTVDPVAHYGFGIETIGSSGTDVRFRLEVRYIAVGEQIDKSVDETILITKTVVNVVDEFHSVAFTLDRTAMAAGDHIELHLERLGNDGADDLDGGIVGIMQDVQFRYND